MTEKKKPSEHGMNNNKIRMDLIVCIMNKQKM